MPQADASTFGVLDALPRWLAWLRRLLERWSTQTTYEITRRSLRIRGTLYGRRIPRRVLSAAEARPTDLSAEPSLVPVRRTNGIGLPGYGAGWFRLASGERVLAFLTDRNRVVYVPTTAGYTLLLSVEDPARFVDELRRI
jgi:hypothetical protein